MIRAQPVPYFGMPFKPQIPVGRTVEVCPFSFDSRDKERPRQAAGAALRVQPSCVMRAVAQALPGLRVDSVALPSVWSPVLLRRMWAI